MALGWLLGASTSGRAELDPYLMLHPLLLLALTLTTARWPLAERMLALVAAVTLAGAAELALVAMPGLALPIDQAARAALAGVALGLLLELAQRLGRAAGGRAGPALGAVAGLALLLAPGPVPWFRRLVLTPEPQGVAVRPRVALLTGLPLMWAEQGPRGTLRGAGNASLRALARRFRIEPVSDATALERHTLALVAQPRPPGPAGLVALDRWARRGGLLLLLVDPALRWPSDLPLGDPRQPPSEAGLGPLLAHWGVRLDRGNATLRVVRSDGRRLALPGAGRLHGCGQSGIVIECRIGLGRAILIADADLLDERSWIGPGPAAESRAARLADNAAFLAASLDRLAGRNPDPADRVRWAAPPKL